MNDEELCEKQIWETWLDDDYGKKLDNIKACVERLYRENGAGPGDLPYFTPHGPQHYRQVENRIHDLIPGLLHKKLSTIEKFYLLASAWLHDIGMLQIVVERVYSDNEQLDDNEIRRRHHLTSEKYIVNHWVDVGVEPADKAMLGKLCRYHSRQADIKECDREPIVRGKKFRLSLLAGYLRIADSLDVGPSRTDGSASQTSDEPEPYAVVMAYDIPADSKLYWIKNRLVSGVRLDPEKHTIYIQFKYPDDIQMSKQNTRRMTAEKVDRVIRMVVDDLRDELTSVMNVLTWGNISYYLDIEEIRIKETLDDRMLNDLQQLVVNSDIEAEPSASRLLEMILVGLANIVGFSLNEKGVPTRFDDIPNIYRRSDPKAKVAKFLTSIGEKISLKKTSHLGVTKLIDECKQDFEESAREDAPLEWFARRLNAKYAGHLESREKIRVKAAELLSKAELLGAIVPAEATDKTQEDINILLYGYSELVTKAICGLRDSLIKRWYSCINPKDIYGSEIEKRISSCIHIFICEGQPKTQTGYLDRLVYHDGSQYALRLAERGFRRTTILPDIVASTVMDSNKDGKREINIHYIFLGANGITKNNFMHTAGHKAIIELARSANPRPTIILVATKEKAHAYGSKTVDASVVTTKGSPDQGSGDTSRTAVIKEKPVGGDNGQIADDKDKFEIVEESQFIKINDFRNRLNIWTVRDKRLLTELREQNVSFLNPKADTIPINQVDYIISDVENSKKITADNAEEEVQRLFFPDPGPNTSSTS